MWEKCVKSRVGHRWQCGACALHAGYPRLQIRTLRLCNTDCFSTATMHKCPSTLRHTYIDCLRLGPGRVIWWYISSTTDSNVNLLTRQSDRRIHLPRLNCLDSCSGSVFWFSMFSLSKTFELEENNTIQFIPYRCSCSPVGFVRVRLSRALKENQLRSLWLEHENFQLLSPHLPSSWVGKPPASIRELFSMAEKP